MDIHNFSVGQSASLSKSFSDTDINTFAGLSLDCNPIHLNEEYASKSLFKHRIVHGFLTGSLISAVIGAKMPGPGSIYLHQEMNFRKPAYLNEVITAVVTITDVNYEKSVIHLDTKCLNYKNDIIIDGNAVIKYNG